MFECIEELKTDISSCRKKDLIKEILALVEKEMVKEFHFSINEVKKLIVVSGFEEELNQNPEKFSQYSTEQLTYEIIDSFENFDGKTPK